MEHMEEGKLNIIITAMPVGTNIYLENHLLRKVINLAADIYWRYTDNVRYSSAAAFSHFVVNSDNIFVLSLKRTLLYSIRMPTGMRCSYDFFV